MNPKWEIEEVGFNEETEISVEAAIPEAHVHKTREALYLAYMEACGTPGLKEKSFDVIEGRPFTGCREFNLAEKVERACEKNRRVTVCLLKSNRNFPIQ